MNGNQWTTEEEELLAEYIARQVCSEGSGSRTNECVLNFPRDRYFIGSLRPTQNEENREDDQPRYLRELLSKLAPVAFGSEFRIRPENDSTEISTNVHWACYYRIFPTLEQQREHQQQGPPPAIEQAQDSMEDDDTEENADDELQIEESSDAAISVSDRRQERTPQDSLFIRFRKIQCSADGVITIIRNQEGMLEVDSTDLQTQLNSEVERARQTVINDDQRIRTAQSPNDRIRVPDTALESQNIFINFLQTLQNDVVPAWSWQIRTEIRPGDETGEFVLYIELTNTSPMQENAPNTEAFLFDTGAMYQFSDDIVLPFELNLAPQGFRYSRNLWARGFNCAVELDNNSPRTFTTTHTPIYSQMRYITRTSPTSPFETLSQDPIPVLNSIYEAMTNYLSVWDSIRQEFVESNSNWETDYGAEFDSDRQVFEDEINRFNRGLQMIRENDDIRLAFKLTNETFSRGDPNKTSWRLFQIVFLVCQIPNIAALDSSNDIYETERQDVDIIYFPTGGGKTEAYLGVIVFHCFFDRLRGKSAGITTWIRFPLRLLTLQQTQRSADVIGIAEIVRSQNDDPRLSGEDVDGFAVGYFVGASSTPNEIKPPTQDGPPDPTWSQANDPAARQRWKRIMRCPSCRTSTVFVDFDPDTIRIIHRCTNSGCEFRGGIIPVYVVDNEIYRYLPCVMVGTIDKLAGVGNQRKISQVFGQVDGRCLNHGYYKIKCCQKNCFNTELLIPEPPAGISGPTLFVQDELHLLKEGLGTFDGHYETFIQRLRQEFGQTKPLKIIASSATIEAFERQVEHLYGREQTQARVFPGTGPSLRESFYAETMEYPQRLFVGLIPHNKTIFNTILELIEYYHREVQYLQLIPAGQPNPYGGSLSPGTIEYLNLLDLYTTSLTYFLNNRELNSIRTDIEGDVNPNLIRDGLIPLMIPELTGSTTTDDVARILDMLEQTAQPNTPPNAVLATSMVSHGVDVDRLNCMIFYGMPRQNSEYIQASSRVGRAHVGIVFDCLHPARERDQSHYSYFIKFHEFLGQLVEPVAINRWSKFSVNRTLPGLFMAVLLQLISNNSEESNPNRYYMLSFVKQKISDGTISADDFIPILEEAYLVQDASEIGEILFRNEIRLRVQQFLDQIIGAGPEITFVSEVLIPRPMISLRDVDEPIEIELDNLGTRWAIRT